MQERIGTLAGEASRLVRRRIERKRPRRRRTPDRLALLFDVHPEARQASPREAGLHVVPIDQIVGSAVEPVQRGRDFRPFRGLRGPDWEARYQRILRAMNRLEVLPPIDVVRFGDGYWVVDGHNRVAAAREVGQVAVDAAVTDLRSPGETGRPAAPIAPYLEQSLELRAAGGGRRMTHEGARQLVDPAAIAAERRAAQGDEGEAS
ncbi:MAG: hypothetical protein H0V36_04000 [Chloroflexi bacterium]|nr:hypothetical protein [Chloroflexota bacterium]